MLQLQPVPVTDDAKLKHLSIHGDTRGVYDVTYGDPQINYATHHTQEAGDSPREAVKGDSNTAQNEHQPGVPGKKKRKPKKKAKHLPLLPSVLAVEDRLAWKLKQNTRLGRHVIAMQSIAAGQLLLKEKPVATVIRDKYAASSCHMCLKELPTGHSAVELAPEILRGAQQYKRYCSPACASADVHAALTAPVHGKLDDIAAATQADPQLLHLLLELDSKRIVSPPALHVRTGASRGWVLHASASAAPEAGSKHTSSNGHHCSCSHPDTHGPSPGLHASSTAAACPVPLQTADKAYGSQEVSQGGQQQSDTVAHASAASATKAQQPKQQKGGNETAGAAGGVPPMQCTLEDVFLLTAHAEVNLPAWQASVGKAVDGMLKAMRDSKAFEPAMHSQYMAMARLVNNNAYGTGVANSSNIDRGLGMWPAVSMLNHSCRPNCFFAWQGGALEVRAVRAVSKGEQLTVSYINPTEPRKIRGRELKATKSFVCACERCTEPIAGTPDMMLEGVKCRQGKCEGFLLEQRGDALSDGCHWVCTGCSRSVPSLPPSGTTPSPAQLVYPEALTASLRRSWEEAMGLMQAEGHAAAKPALERVQAQAQEALHPMHAIIVDCLMPLVNCSRAVQDHAAAVRHLQQLLAALELIIGCHSVELGNLYGLLGQLHLQRASSLPAALQARCKKQAKEACSRALTIYTTCLGESHGLCQEQKTSLRMLR